MTSSSRSGARFNPKIVWTLVLATVAYRVFASQFPNLSNTSPTMALCFGGGLLLGKRFWWIPPALVLLGDFALGLFHGSGGIGTYTILTMCLFCGAAFLGSRLAGWSGKTWPTMWCGVLLSSIVFYVVANTFAWAAYPGYIKSLSGWWQSQTTGLPEFSPPAWVFLRNALIADSVWCALAGILFFFEGKCTVQAAKQVEAKP